MVRVCERVRCVYVCVCVCCVRAVVAHLDSVDEAEEASLEDERAKVVGELVVWAEQAQEQVPLVDRQHVVRRKVEKVVQVLLEALVLGLGELGLDHLPTPHGQPTAHTYRTHRTHIPHTPHTEGKGGDAFLMKVAKVVK